MKKIFCLFFVLFIFVYSLTFSASSFTFDGKDTGVEWDGATVYSLVDGESNCGVSFGAVKVKFDYDTDAVCMCFYFIDSEFTADNPYAGVSLNIEGEALFEITASDGVFSENISPYSFDGAVFIDGNNGATCEIRAGIKSGLPETVDCEVRFIDSHGNYSNYYIFSIINEAYVKTETLAISPTSDNTDVAYNTDAGYNTTKKNSVKKETTNRKTTRKSLSKTFAYVEIKTSPPYSYTGRTYSRNNNKSTERNTTVNSTVNTTKDNQTVKVYHEKVIYISEVYITETIENTTEKIIESSQTGNQIMSTSDTVHTTKTTEDKIGLSEGVKYRKIVTAAGVIAFAVIAFFGTYSAKKGSKRSTDD